MNWAAENAIVTIPDSPRWVSAGFFLRRMRCMFFCGVLFSALGLLLGLGLPLLFYFIGGRVLPTADWQLDRQHSSATAMLTNIREVKHTRVGSQHPWQVDFRFKTGAGVIVDARGYTYDQSYASKTMGEFIDVEYQPDQPTNARPVGGSRALIPAWTYLLVLGIVGSEGLLGVILLLATWAQARQERMLLTHGEGVMGEVVDVRRIKHIHFGSRSPYDVYYAFRDQRGLEVYGHDRTYHYDWAEALRPGDQVGVIFNPDEPLASVLWLHGSSWTGEG
ncbi:MAG: DUF3592 domain-containing protein [Planctomycetota bacterium]